MNEYICIECEQIFNGQFNCPSCGSENYVPLFQTADEDLFIGGMTEFEMAVS